MSDHVVEPIDYESDIIQFIDDGSIVPVISNAFRLEQIFRDDAELLDLMLKNKIEFYDEAYTIDQQLTKAWAASKEYPMSDDHNLARVAQYREVVLDESELAKKEYLNFLGHRLLKNNLNRQGYDEIVAKYQKGTQRTTITNLARELDMPISFPEGREDPLRLLARLKLPVYITTSYFTFLEDALVKEKLEPSTQVWSWGTKVKMQEAHIPKREYEPNPLKPVVYHLFGLEEYVKSLVLSEDDYMDFLVNSASAISSLDVFPQPLRDALSQSRLLMFGYHPQSWDFRALFRFILEFRKHQDQDIPKSIALQFKYDLENKDFEKKSLSYLESYFKGHKFKVKWIDPEQFLYELSDAMQSRER